MNKFVEVCLTPPLLPFLDVSCDDIIVVADILRASTTICAAFDNKAAKIIPVATVEEAMTYKKQGFFVAGERGGRKLEFADAGNSPLELLNPEIRGKTIILSTTNGTIAIKKAASIAETIIGSFNNFNALASWLLHRKRNILIVCAGWQNRVSLEDTLFAGALIEELRQQKKYLVHSDEAWLAFDLWQQAKDDVISFIAKGSHPKRLKEIGQDDSLEYCFKTSISLALPVYNDGAIIDLNAQV